MSNVALFENMSDTYKKMLAQLQPEKNFSGSSGGGNRLSIRGGVFRKVVAGEEVGTLDGRSLQVVFVKAAPISRTYYANEYKEGEITSPTCWSPDGRFPDAAVLASDRQGSNCGDCPMNIKGSGKGDSRACRFQQRVVVILPNADSEFVSDAPYLLSIPATSLFGDNKEKMSMQNYVRRLHAHQTPLAAVVTEMRFDTDSSTPRLFFKPIRPLDEEELSIVARMQLDREVEGLLTMDYKPQDGNTSAKTPAAALFSDSKDDDDDDEVEEAPAPKKKAKPTPPPVEEDDEEEEEAPAPKVKTKKATPAEPSPAVDISDIMSDWDD